MLAEAKVVVDDVVEIDEEVDDQDEEEDHELVLEGDMVA